MKSKAAVCYEAGKELVIETVDLEGPKFGEVLVEIKASGVCHTDEFTRSGGDPEGLFPVIFGHEGAGIVVDVGPGIVSLKKGDHVIPLYTPECRACKSCLSGKTNLCTAIRGTQGQGVMPDGTSRFSIGGKKVHHYMGCSTFSNYTVLPEIALADDLRTVWWPTPTDDDDASWELRRQIWETEGTMLGGSDAGAHLDRMCGSNYPTSFLGDCLRGRKLIPVEEAVRMITKDPADLFGLTGRGVIAEGGTGRRRRQQREDQRDDCRAPRALQAPQHANHSSAGSPRSASPPRVRRDSPRRRARRSSRSHRRFPP